MNLQTVKLVILFDTANLLLIGTLYDIYKVVTKITFSQRQVDN